MTPTETIELVSRVGLLWPSMALTSDKARAIAAVWHEHLADTPYPAVLAALRTWESGDWHGAPSAPELRAAAERLLPDAPSDLDVVLATVGRQIRAVGWCGRPTWPDPAYDALVAALGGWREVCSQGTEWLRKDVTRLWPTIAKRARDRAALGEMALRFGELKGPDDAPDRRREIAR